MDVLSLARDPDPTVLAVLPDRDLWRREGRVREGPDRDDQVFRLAAGMEDGRTAFGTEVEAADLRVLIGVADELLGLAADGDTVRRKARLVAVGAAGPALSAENYRTAYPR